MTIDIRVGDCRKLLAAMPDASINCCVTSPPYFGLRDYGVDGQMGLEETPDEFIAGMVAVFREVRRVLTEDGTLWLNIGDSYAGAPAGWQGKQHGVAPGTATARIRHVKKAAGLKSKDLIGIPWMLAFALRADGWYLRQDIIWSKPNPMPESVKDRCTKSHEYLFLLSKSPQYHYDATAIQEQAIYVGLRGQDESGFKNAAAYAGKHSANPGVRLERAGRKQRGVPPRHANYSETSDQSGLDQVGRGGLRNKRSVWTVATQPFRDAHFATFPPALIEPCILAGCPIGGTVIDPFGGAGTTGLVADRLQRNSVLIELNPAYAEIARSRIAGDRGGLLDGMEAA